MKSKYIDKSQDRDRLKVITKQNYTTPHKCSINSCISNNNHVPAFLDNYWSNPPYISKSIFFIAVSYLQLSTGISKKWNAQRGYEFRSAAAAKWPKSRLSVCLAVWVAVWALHLAAQVSVSARRAPWLSVSHYSLLTGVTFALSCTVELKIPMGR